MATALGETGHLPDRKKFVSREVTTIAGFITS
jgi:hypothetical protein